MNSATILNQYLVILDLEEQGAWYLASILRKQLAGALQIGVTNEQRIR